VQRSVHSKSALMHLHWVQPLAAVQVHFIRSLHVLLASGIAIHPHRFPIVIPFPTPIWWRRNSRLWIITCSPDATLMCYTFDVLHHWILIIHNTNGIRHGNVSWQCFIDGRVSIDLAFLVKSSLRVTLTECWRLDLSYITTVLRFENILKNIWMIQISYHVYEEKI